MNRGIAKHDLSDIYSAQSNISSNTSQANEQMKIEAAIINHSDYIDNIKVISIDGNVATASFTMTSRDTSSEGKTLVREWEGQ